MNLFVVPIESYDSRYTEQWNRWFPALLRSSGVDFEYMAVDDGNMQAELGGSVLDPIRTNRYRMAQIDRLLQKIDQGAVKDGDVVFFHTLWFPGIEALAYVRDTLKIRFHVVGVLHAGSYDAWDFRAQSGMDRWSAPLEISWLELTDRIILASEFHRQMLVASRSVDPRKLFVTGLPFRSAEIRSGRESLMGQKRELIAFPHRDAPEKSPDLVPFLNDHFGDSRVVVTRKRSASKSEYLDLLAECRVCVSDSQQETFGYSMLEATALGCVPLVPDRLCYPEMYPKRYRFSSRDELVKLTRSALNGEFGPLDDLEPLMDWVNSSARRILDLVLKW